jgi:hypothetical protein
LILVKRSFSWRDVSLSAVLILQLMVLFVSEPLAALGLSLFYPLSLLVLVALVGVVLGLAPSRSAAITSVALIIAYIVCLALRFANPSPATIVAFHVAGLLAIGHATSVVARAAFARGPVSWHRIGGAVAIYFNIALMFSIAYRLTNDLVPGSFNGIPDHASVQQSAEYLLYFSIITISTTGFGDITPASPIAHSLASLEAVVGQLYIATFLGRLISLNTDLLHSRDETDDKSEL